MGDRASVRLRTTALSMLVMAIALLAGSVALLFLSRASLRNGIETTAEQRASALAAQIGTTGLPTGPEEDDDDDLLWQIQDAGGSVVRSSPGFGTAVPAEETDQTDIAGTEHQYLIVTEDAGDWTVVVAASLEELDESTDALVTPLLIGLPLVLVVVGGVTWLVVTRALAPVERIRREVEEITGDRLDRRVPEPAARDEIQRLAATMNRMLTRLEESQQRQQRFVADASHELRSPLSSIRQAAEVAREHPGALPEGELAEAVLEESGRMQRLVEQLLLLTRTGEGVVRSFQEVDLDDLALAEARRVRRSGLTVDASGVGAGRVRGELTALAQVVRNLTDNAARHARSTVGVVVRTRADGVELIVEDDGAGIPAGERERVFERFVRLDEARTRDEGGSGLGLAIVWETVHAHGGTVTVSDSPLGGARFGVRLPAP
ncbi:sensor histidine kinase [Actinoplanes couchii]|uniref:histidine kinase n=1 Tax=Actinoplanes couchii TaxID=403638 RepID=A0ABQ3XQM6_9ACTN|nr:ATP-binding protein [Actinoplanes couchii]MDR6317498.1 signal transduction histidine kinase [Actinoplanes couchii]GID60801.1 two-component sensor histidine kinase [Actinoplanes couchii]